MTDLVFVSILSASVSGIGRSVFEAGCMEKSGTVDYRICPVSFCLQCL